MRILLALLLALGTGCAVHVGMDGIDVAMAGSFYSHSEPVGEACEGGGRWFTHVGRTWGTAAIEIDITPEGETVSVVGDGMSDNTRGVLGDDLGGKALDSAACALQPLQPGCLGL